MSANRGQSKEVLHKIENLPLVLPERKHNECVPSFFQNLRLDLAALFWPCECLVCGAENRELCFGCEGQIVGAGGLVEVVGVSFVDPLTAVKEYEGVYKKMIVALKHEGSFRFIKPLGKLMALALEPHLKKLRRMPLLVTMPSRRKKLEERGFDHLRLISLEALRHLNLPKNILKSGALVTTRGRTGQVGLDITERQQNAAKIKVSRRHQRVIAGREIILIDDIVTTGASLKQAADRLNLHGAKVIGASTICFAVKRIEKARTKMGGSD